MLAKILQPFFWYTDNKKMDKHRDRVRIILQVLEYGDKPAVDWIFKNYSKAVIKKVLLDKGFLELSNKSFNYWSIIFKLDQSKVKKTRIPKSFSLESFFKE